MVAPNEWEEAIEEAIDMAKTLEDHTPVEVTIEEELDSETAPHKIAPDPSQPTSRQMAEHRITHSPYRILCKF